MQRELVMLREVRDAAQEIAEAMDIPEGNEDEPLSLAGKLRKLPEAFERYVSTTTRQYVGHVLGLVKSYWPTTHLDARKGAMVDCTDEQFRQYVE
jgi:DNA-directed RNA polymerase specialized sigma24 family protein